MPAEFFARRMAEIESFHVMEILARARELEARGRSVIHMEIGEPDFPTPAPVVEAGVRALRGGDLRYTLATGLPALREAIAAFYFSRYGVTVAPSRIMVTAGSSGALLLAMGVLLNPGDQILMADPGYPCNRHFARFVEGNAVAVPVDEGSSYQLTPALVDRHWTPRTRAVLLASPANPTGTLVPDADLSAIAAIARERGGTLIVDEIYHGLVYEGEAQTALALGENIVVVNSFSKYFNMTGWRLGWLVAPESWMGELDRLAQNIFIAPSTPAQHAALAAFQPDTLAILEARRAEMKARRDFLLPALRELGFGIAAVPQGAFYLYANCESFTSDSFAFAHRVLDEAGVAITPGLDFGRHRAEKHVRFAYTTSLEKLREGVARLKAFLHP